MDDAVKKARCAEEVTIYQGGWPTYHQCSRAGVVEENSKLWCKQHAPSAKEKRQSASKARSDAAWRKRQMEFIGPAAVRLLRVIAEGHNDPRKAAQDFLSSRGLSAEEATRHD